MKVPSLFDLCINYTLLIPQIEECRWSAAYSFLLLYDGYIYVIIWGRRTVYIWHSPVDKIREKPVKKAPADCVTFGWFAVERELSWENRDGHQSKAGVLDQSMANSLQSHTFSTAMTILVFRL